MSDEMPDFLRKMFEHMRMVELSLGGEKGSWVNVAKLSPEDVMKKEDGQVIKYVPAPPSQNT